MQFKDILKELSKRLEVRTISSLGMQEIQNVLLIEGSETIFDDQVLYFGYASQIYHKQEIPANCILVCEKKKIPFSAPNLSLVSETQLFSAFNQAKALMEEQGPSYFYEELIDSVSGTGSLDTLANKAAAKLGNPIILLDAEFKVLSHSTIFSIDDALWADNIAQGYCSYEFIKAVNELGTVKQAPQTNEVFEVTCPASPARKLCSKVLVKENKIGMVLMLLQNPSVSTIQLQILRTVSLAVGEALVKHFPFLLPSNTPTGQVLYDLLIGASPKDIASRIATLSFSPRFIALAIQKADAGGQKNLIQTSLLLEHLVLGIQVVFFDQGIAALYPLGENAGLTTEQRAVLVRFAQRHSLRIGISIPLQNPEDFARYYRQACQALVLGKRHMDQGPLFSYEHYLSDDLFASVERHTDLASFCHPAISLLQDYDRKNKTELVRTLEMFLAYGNSAKEAALHLCLHRNSLTYRMKRIVQITSLNLQDPNTLFILRLSFGIRQFLGEEKG